MTARSIAVVSAGLSQPSSTRLLADRLAAATRERLESEGFDVRLEFVELRDTAVDVTNNLLTGYPSPRLERVLDLVTGADALIAVSPIFTTSYSGLFKSFIDILNPQSLTGMPVLLGATGGSERHSLALDYSMRPLFTYMHAVVAPTAVFAASSDWGSSTGSATGTGSAIGAGQATGASPISDRIDRAAAEFAALVRESDRSQLVGDPFALPEGFSPAGAYGAQ